MTKSSGSRKTRQQSLTPRVRGLETLFAKTVYFGERTVWTFLGQPTQEVRNAVYKSFLTVRRDALHVADMGSSLLNSEAVPG